jgi:hypothetical protein
MRLFPILALLTAAAPAVAADYTLLIYESPAQLALRADPGPKGAAYWKGFADAGAALAKAGVLKGGAALNPRAASVGKGTATAPTGYFVISAPNLETARALAAALPAVKTGHVDIEPHAPTKTRM